LFNEWCLAQGMATMLFSPIACVKLWPCLFDLLLPSSSPHYLGILMPLTLQKGPRPSSQDLHKQHTINYFQASPINVRAN
jgi:hypothetical protein